MSAVVTLSIGVEGVDRGPRYLDELMISRATQVCLESTKKAHRRTGPQRVWTCEYHGTCHTHIRRTLRTSVWDHSPCWNHCAHITGMGYETPCGRWSGRSWSGSKLVTKEFPPPTPIPQSMSGGMTSRMAMSKWKTLLACVCLKLNSGVPFLCARR